MSLDDLRERGSSFLSKKESQSNFAFDYEADFGEAPLPKAPTQRYFLGMTPAQRFVLSLMLLFMTCIIGSFCLLVTERVVPPGLY